MPTFLPNPWMKVILPIVNTPSGRRTTISWGVRPSVPALDIVINAVDTDWRAAFRDRLDTECTVGPAEFYQTTSGGELIHGVSTVAPQAGLRAGASPTSNVALVFRKRTSFVGRRFRGRFFLPWAVDETGVNEVGQLSASAIAGYNGDAAAWLAAANGSPQYEGIWLLHAERDTPPQIVPTRVESVVVAPVVGTQRRRLEQI